MSFKVIGIGEVLWDLFPAGSEIGGAPANFACHAQALGARAGVVTRIGNDALGRDLLDHFKRAGVPTNLMQVDPAAPTGTVTIDLDGGGVPQFVIREHAAWDFLQPTPAALAAVARADAVCFGTLAQRGEPSRGAIQELLRRAPAASLRMLDINLRQNFYNQEVVARSLELANALKLNDAELPILAKLLHLSGMVREQIALLADRFELSLVALTRGPQGSLLFERGRWSECRARPVPIKDTVGAGDAFTAALVMGRLRKMDLDQINFAANEVAQFVCTRSGATPPLPAELVALFPKPSCPAPVVEPRFATAIPAATFAK